MTDLPNALKSLRKNFYRDNYRKAINGLLAAGFIIVLLVMAVSYVAMHRTPPDYYATSSDGGLMKITSIQK